jgi:hypothetical protein
MITRRVMIPRHAPKAGKRSPRRFIRALDRMIVAWRWYQALSGAGTHAEVRAWWWFTAWRRKVRRMLAEIVDQGEDAPPPWVN